MLERVRRRMAAEVKYPSVKAGRTRCARPPRPPAGSTPSTTAKNRINMSPSQNVGIDWPSTANTRAAAVHDPSPAHGGVHAEGDPDEHAQEHGHEPQLDGGGQPLPDVLGDRPPGEHGVPEVAEGDVLHVDPVLDGQGLIQAQVAHQDLLIALGGVDVQQQMDGIAREPGQQEHDADHHQHAQQRLQHPAEQIPPHAVWPRSTAPGSRTPSCGCPCGRGSAASPPPSAPRRRSRASPRWRRPGM